MANSTNINNPETTTNAQIQGAGLVLPLSVNERNPNKISTLFTPNSSVLYSKYSPYPEGQSGGFFGANQPAAIQRYPLPDSHGTWGTNARTNAQQRQWFVPRFRLAHGATSSPLRLGSSICVWLFDPIEPRREITRWP